MALKKTDKNLSGRLELLGSISGILTRQLYINCPDSNKKII